MESDRIMTVQEASELLDRYVSKDGFKKLKIKYKPLEGEEAEVYIRPEESR